MEDVNQKLFELSSNLEEPTHKLAIHLSSIIYALGDYDKITSGLHKLENLSNVESHITAHFLEFH